ncbi:MAG: hypothetical protein QW478_06105 [Candidatus Micrarchaeaceae archaeon]
MATRNINILLGSQILMNIGAIIIIVSTLLTFILLVWHIIFITSLFLGHHSLPIIRHFLNELLILIAFFVLGIMIYVTGIVFKNIR